MVRKLLDEKGKYAPPIRRLIVFSLFILLLFSAIITYQARQSYDVVLERGRASAERLTQSLANHVELSFRNADLSIKRAIERVYFNTLFGRNLADDIEHNFRLWLADMPQAVAMYMTDTEGRVVLSANKEGYGTIFRPNDRVDALPFFTETREASDAELFIGHVLHEGQRFILLARKYLDAGGNFAGEIYALIDPAYFMDFFHAIETGKRSHMMLMQTDGEALINASTAPALAGIMEEKVKADSSEPGHIVITRLHAPESETIYAFVKLWDLPVVVSTAIDVEDFLSGWRRDRIKDVSFLALFTIFGSVLSFFALTMAAQIRRVEESESAAVHASQAKSEFLANVSHELRTPLNAIIGFSEMLDSGYFGPLNNKQKERVHDINLCGTHLLQLINDILDFSKGDAGKMELETEVFSLRDVIDECERIMLERCTTHKLTLKTRVQEQLPALYADKRKIRQVLLNLLSNAVKFTPEGGVITISAVRDPGGNLTIAVEDTGIGIAEGDIPKALSVFGQVHRDSSHQGTGLGLPLCRMFAELHGGELHLESTVGRGTTVFITLPSTRMVSGEDIDPPFAL